MPDKTPWYEVVGYFLNGIMVLLGLLFLIVLLTGCGDIAHQYQRTVWGIDCRQDKLIHGQCAPVAAAKKGTP